MWKRKKKSIEQYTVDNEAQRLALDYALHGGDPTPFIKAMKAQSRRIIDAQLAKVREQARERSGQRTKRR